MTKSHTKSFANPAITALLIIALGLGVALYIKHTPTLSKSLIKSSGPKLTDLEKSILINPSQNASDEEKKAYSKIIGDNAKDGQTIFVKDCTARPIVLRMSYGAELNVINEGTTDIHFGFGDERTLVKAGTSTKIPTTFKNGRGIYGYGCDDRTLGRSIGVLLLTK